MEELLCASGRSARWASWTEYLPFPPATLSLLREYCGEAALATFRGAYNEPSGGPSKLMSAPDMDGLILAMTSALDSIRHYYDRETGEVVTLSEEFGTGRLDGPSERYVYITPLSVSERFQIMEDFVETLDNEALQDELNKTLSEKAAFLRFDEALSRYPSRNKQWEGFRSDRVAARARAWLSEHDIE